VNPLFFVGMKVKLRNFKQRFTVRAAGWRYAVCTKPFNAQRTTIYTIIDFDEGVRGTENLVFGCGAETDQDCVEMLARLESGETKVSSRNRLKFNGWLLKPNEAVEL